MAVFKATRLGIVALMLMCGVREAHTGTYGSIDQDFDGFRVSIDTSVGSLSDHSAEGKRFAEANQAAKRFIAESTPLIKQLTQHYRRDDHPYKRLRAFLLPQDVKGRERQVLMELVVPAEGDANALLMPSTEERRGTLHIFADLKLADAWQQKLGADLALSQLSKGGLFEKSRPSSNTHRDLLSVEQLLGSLLLLAQVPSPQEWMLRMVEGVRANQDLVAQIATRTTPVPAEQTWNEPIARCGFFAAKAMQATLQHKPYGEDVWSTLDSLPKADAERAVQLLVLLLPDDGWQSGLAAVRKHAKLSENSAIRPWLDAFNQAP